MSYLVKIIDKKHPSFGHILKGSLVYYDIHHTGDSPDLYQVINDDGTKFRLLSIQIDEKHYKSQLLAKQIARLGAKTGDEVIITKGGSGSFIAGWDPLKPHIITDIDCTGHVKFDDGDATIFQPEVKLAWMYSYITWH